MSVRIGEAIGILDFSGCFFTWAWAAGFFGASSASAGWLAKGLTALLNCSTNRCSSCPWA